MKAFLHFGSAAKPPMFTVGCEVRPHPRGGYEVKHLGRWRRVFTRGPTGGLRYAFVEGEPVTVTIEE